MSTVSERLAEIGEEIHALRKRQRALIADEPPTFMYLPATQPRRYSPKERYVMVYADGSLARSSYDGGVWFTQRPAALRTIRSSGRYMWDTRENVILDGEGTVVHTVGGTP